ncbi:MAG: response regulator [Desulfobacteraceae bacterium]|jgi:response regulator RpfG family c-di-GMP phosphodiesterase
MKILIVDDDASTLELLAKSMVKWGYTIEKAENGKLAIEHLKDSRFDMIVSDWLMPEMDGLELCKQIRSLDLKHYVYIILISAQNTRTDVVRGLEGGVDDFITKPLNLDELRARLEIGARIIKLERELNQKYLAIKRNYYQSIHMFTQLLETYDTALGSHSRRVGRLCLDLAKRHQGVLPEAYPIIEAAGLLHDIGLIGLPNSLVIKSVHEMTGDEKNLYFTHPERGETILRQFDLLRPVAGLVRLHHEQPNGRGFPDAISAEHIPVGASIVSAASTYDTMVHQRKWSFKEIAEKLQQMRDYQLPTEFVELLLEINLENMAAESKRTDRQVDIDDLKPGMVLASDVQMKSGAFVMAADTVVCENAIEKLQRYYDLGNIGDKVYINK